MAEVVDARSVVVRRVAVTIPRVIDHELGVRAGPQRLVGQLDRVAHIAEHDRHRAQRAAPQNLDRRIEAVSALHSEQLDEELLHSPPALAVVVDGLRRVDDRTGVDAGQRHRDGRVVLVVADP